MTEIPQSIELTFRANLEAEESLEGFMLVSATIEGIEETSDGLIHYYLPIAEWNDAFKLQLAQFLSVSDSAELLEATPLEVKDWNAAWEASIEPLRVTDELVISPSWKLEVAQKLGAKYLIEIDPKMSFGTGHHETTRLCLKAIETIDVSGKSVLDIGTGSGILAIYTLLRGANHATGIDTDSWSIENVEENRLLNKIPSDVFLVKQGTLAEVGLATEKFDIILANIHRNILIEIATEISLRSKKHTMLVLSGLLTYDAEEVTKRYETAGFELLDQLRENEWIALVMRYSG